MRKVRFLWISALALALLGGRPAGPAPVESEAAARTRLGREATKAKKPDVARHHFLDAVALEQGYVPAWSELAALDAGDPDAKALWALDAAWAGVDASGRPPKASFAAPLLSAEMTVPLDLAAKRAALVRAVVDAFAKIPAADGVVVVRWLRALADEAAGSTLALAAVARGAAEKALERCRPDGSRLRAALLAALNEAKAAGNLGRSLVAARLLVGLATQRRAATGSKAMSPELLGSHFALDEARTALRAQAPAPLAYSDLEALLDPERRHPFEDAHASWADPIVVMSSKGRYRIESTCGLDTTREAAGLVESCHDRLVAWCGKDPFGGRTGVVRLCPTYPDFESEGQPYWWAQGFQSRDTLTVVVQWNTVDDLSRLLAHELTHRFDAAMRPGLGAWAMEGRATYVAATTTHGHIAALDERAIDAHELESAYRIVGGQYESLADILAGKDPEYRHNYPVGYALWTFLSQWTGDEKPPGGPTPYRDRIPALLEALAAAPGTQVRAFEGSLCDGKEGRASSLHEFSKQLSAFLKGFYEDATPPWAAAYRDRSAGAESDLPWDYALSDRSNYPTVRQRLDASAEGEGVAAMAAQFLEGCGKAAEALEAHALADTADELDLPRYRRALALETGAGRKEAAFARGRLVAGLDPAGPEAASPDLGSLAPVGAAASAYLAGLAKASADAIAASRPRTARALRAEHDAVAVLAGRAPLGEAGLEAPAPLVAGNVHGDPDCPPAYNPLAAGIVEERWSAQEDGALSGLYGLPSPDQVELGRKSQGPVVTGEDRDAKWVGVAVRTLATVVGTYTVRTRVRPAGEYVDGRVIVGWTRRDRGVEFSFRSGDRASAERTGESLAGASGAEVSVSDLRQVDGRATTLSRHVGLLDARAGFDLAVHVAGPYVRVQVDGKDALSFRRVTGEPVEGSVGFAIDRGRTVFAEVRVERHRVLGPDRACRCDRFDAPLDLMVPGRFSWTSLVGRRVVGLEPSPHVRLLLWSTGLASGDPTGAGTVREAIETCRKPFASYRYPLEVHVAARGARGPDGTLALPPSFPLASSLEISDDNLHAHAGFPGLDSDVENIPQTYELGWPGWGGIFIDPSGIARSRGPIDDISRGLRLSRYVEGR